MLFQKSSPVHPFQPTFLLHFQLSFLFSVLLLSPSLFLPPSHLFSFLPAHFLSFSLPLPSFFSSFLSLPFSPFHSLFLTTNQLKVPLFFFTQLRDNAQGELKQLREELLDKKINLTLTKSQKSLLLLSNQENITAQ